jgi:hypothetical protein
MLGFGFGAGMGSKYEIVTTVLDEPKSYALTDLVTVKQELNLTTTDANRDAVLTRYIDACSHAIQTYCNRVFAVRSVQDEIRPPREGDLPTAVAGIDPLQLSSWPVVTSDPPTALSVIEGHDTVLTLGEDFELDARRGRLIRLNLHRPCRWYDKAVVQYSAGYATLPADVVDACIDFVKFRYFARMRDPSLKSENVVGVYEASYLWGTGPGGPDDMPATVAGKIDRYRVPVIG